MPLESRLVSRFIEGAQTQVEGRNFDMRKHVVDYDDVIAKQREVIYSDRRSVLERGDMHERIVGMIRAEVGRIVDACIPSNMVTEEEQLETLFKTLEVWVEIPADMIPENLHAVRREQLKEDLIDLVIEHYEQRGASLKNQASEQGIENFDPQREFERSYLLQVVDRLWMDHIDSLDVMRQGIGFRSLAQRDPLVEFKNEAFRMFDELKVAIQHYTVDALLKFMRNEMVLSLEPPAPQRKQLRDVRTNTDDIARASGQAKTDGSNERTKAIQGPARKNGPQRNNGNRAAATATATRAPAAIGKIGRNDLCPCGSGKKYKKCHGA